LNGRATVLTGTMPWHIRYSSFLGTLPAITSIRIAIAGLAMQVNVGGVACLLRTDAFEPARADLSLGLDGNIAFVDLDASAVIDLEDDDFLCAIAGSSWLDGTGFAHSLSIPIEVSFTLI
jgi:hypothetical protein